MIITVIIIVLLLIISAISKSIMDLINFKFSDSVFSKLRNKEWFDPSESWKNKYKDRDPQKGAAFFGSTTFLSWITDAWHFFQMIMLSCFQLIIVLLLNQTLFVNYELTKLIVIDILSFISIKTIFGFVFELFWKKILLKK